MRSNSKFAILCLILGKAQLCIHIEEWKYKYNSELKVRYDVTENMSDFKPKLMKYDKETMS